MNIILSTGLAIARTEIGVKETVKNGHGTNRGTRVDEYQRADTLPGEGYSWCCSFTGWDIKQTETKLNIDVPWTFSASCDVVWADARKRGLIRSKPQPGFIFLVRAQLLSGLYSATDAVHTGFVEDLLPSNFFQTIEGNTNADGGREGTSVMSHKRPISDRYVFLDYSAGIDIKTIIPAPSQKDMWKAILRKGKESKTVMIQAYDERPTIATRDFAEFFDLPLVWDAVDSQAILSGHEVPTQARLMGGRSFYPVRELGETVGYNVNADSKSRIVEVVAK